MRRDDMRGIWLAFIGGSLFWAGIIALIWWLTR